MMRTARAGAAVMVMAAALLSFGQTGPAALASPDGAAGTSASAAHLAQVTLVTGDHVHVTTRQGGSPSVTVEPAAGRDPQVTFSTRTSEDGHITVVPSDAWPLLNAEQLDERLFDVSQLIKDGYDDAHRTSLPLIVQYAKGAAGSATRGRTLTATTRESALPSIDAEAVTARKAEESGFWASVTQDTAGGLTLAPGVAHVWLDGQVMASLDQSVPQIGAPAAWDAGFTGKGVKTAVLDTGIDETHPDLADAIAEARDFTGSPDGPHDNFGHGTHVASIITGSGAASDGKYKGVASDTQLLVGKVLGDDGTGPDSQVIEGMQWAVDEGARVVNMSLGSGLGSDGTEPLAQAVNQLTESSGTLFVIAAGNLGHKKPGRIESPGSADAALTVGAVDKSDQLADFSGAGPRLGDNAVKPEITAPGVGIVAARAAGTDLSTLQGDTCPGEEPVNDRYTRLCGTSMATPHVAGAAAILAGEHPDWKADRLKAALTSSAKPNPDLSVFDQGTGRLDVAQAFSRQVYASPSATSLFQKFGSSEPAGATVTYTNDGDAPLTLDLNLDVKDQKGAAAAVAALDKDQVTVPAHGTADATLHSDPAAIAPGAVYGGVLTATAQDGTAIRTAVSASGEVESYDVTFKATDRNGRPVTGIDALAVPPILVNLDDREMVKQAQFVDGRLVARVPKGSYGAVGWIQTSGTDGGPASLTLVDEPEVTADQPVTVTMDARKGTRVSASVDAPTKPAAVHYGVIVDASTQVDLLLPAPATAELYAVPVKPTVNDQLTFYYIPTLESTAAPGDTPTEYDLAFVEKGGIPHDLVYRARDRDLATIEDHGYVPAGPNLTVVLLPSVNVPSLGEAGLLSVSEPREIPLPFTKVREVSTTSPAGEPLGWKSDAFVLDGGNPVVVETELAPTPLEPGQHVVDEWDKAAFGPAMFFAARDDTGMEFNVDSAVGAGPGHNVADVLGPDTQQPGAHETVTLSRDGQQLAAVDGTHFSASVPPDPGQYELDLHATRSVGWTPLATMVDAAWTFPSASPGEDQGELLPLPTLRITGDMDDHDRAPAGKSFGLDLRLDGWQGVTPTPAKSVTLEASYDDGTTWQPAQVTAAGDGHWTAALDHPADAQFVSLRASVGSENGFGLKQTVIRAYALDGNAGG